MSLDSEFLLLYFLRSNAHGCLCAHHACGLLSHHNHKQSALFGEHTNSRRRKFWLIKSSQANGGRGPSTPFCRRGLFLHNRPSDTLRRRRRPLHFFCGQFHQQRTHCFSIFMWDQRRPCSAAVTKACWPTSKSGGIFTPRPCPVPSSRAERSDPDFGRAALDCFVASLLAVTRRFLGPSLARLGGRARHRMPLLARG